MSTSLQNKPQNETIETLRSGLSLLRSETKSESDILLLLRFQWELGGEHRRLALETAKALAKQGQCRPIIDLLWGPVLTEEQILERDERGNCVHEGLYLEPYQWDMINSVMLPGISRVWVKGNTGCGKNTGSAFAVLVYYICYPDAKVVITRDTFDEAKVKAWGECVKWWERAKWFPPGRCRGDGFFSHSQHWIEVKNPKTDEGFRGGHSEFGHMMFWFDEASSIPQSRYDMADTQADVVLSTFNPSAGSGPSRKAFPRGDAADLTQTIRGPFGGVRLITIAGMDCLNVRQRRLKRPVSPPGGITIGDVTYPAGEAIPHDIFLQARSVVPGQSCLDDYLGIMSNADPQYRRVFGEGKFPQESSETQVVSESWLDPCHNRYERWWKAWRWAHGEPLAGEVKAGTVLIVRPRAIKLLEAACPVTAVGIDVAGSVQGDESVLTFGGKKGIRKQVAKRVPSVPGMCRWFNIEATQLGLDKNDCVLGVDADGIGLGAANILEEEGWTVIRCYGATTKDVDTERFQNARVQRICKIGERLDPQGEFYSEKPFMLPNDPMLTQELLVYERIPIAGGLKITVTPKRGKPVLVTTGDAEKVIESIEKQLGRSPDRSDSFGYMFEAEGEADPNIDGWI